MKIIFLDIDGVLNHDLHYEEKSQDDRFDEVGLPLCNISNSSVLLLNKLTDDTGAKIVLSSSWRYGKTINELKGIFRKAGITGELIGKTPALEIKQDWRYSVPRGLEIRVWLNNYSGTDGHLSYVILDDEDDMLLYQKDVFLQVDGYCGLTPMICWRAKNILNRN